jgi:hypothetical protein
MKHHTILTCVPVEDKTITLNEFYKQFPYYNPDSIVIIGSNNMKDGRIYGNKTRYSKYTSK